MPSRSPMRIVAPGALVAVVVVVLLVLESGSGDPTTAPTAQTTTTRAKHPKRTSYTVQENDTLSSIAEHFGLTVERLRRLNPDVDPQALRKDQRLRLRK